MLKGRKKRPSRRRGAAKFMTEIIEQIKITEENERKNGRVLLKDMIIPYKKSETDIRMDALRERLRAY